MFSWFRPSPAAIDAFLAAQAEQQFSYSHVGAIEQHSAPAGYTLDTSQVELGLGTQMFARACEALRAWRHFQLGWVEVHPSDTLLEAGLTVAVLARAYGSWALNACRIVRVIDETNKSCQRFGFVYGTLPEHAESGEERFLIEWDREHDLVTYSSRAFSRPNHFLTRVAYPLVRELQRRFREDSGAAMVRACR